MLKEKQLTKAEWTSLIESYARKHYAMMYGAREKSVQRLVNAFSDNMDKMVEKYPYLDLDNNMDFKVELNRRSKEWWDSRVMRGSGVDW